MKLAVLLPCYNEEGAITKVVQDFQRILPTANIYVYDNNSTDRTIEEALAAGAIVRNEKRQGKGHVVRRMFADIDADVYIMADGDGTYDAEAAPELVRKLVDERLDMVVGARVPEDGHETYRPGHKFGNRMLTGLVARIFGRGFEDMLSGYRVFSRRFVKSFPALSQKFEIETELTIHALSMTLPCEELPTRYFERAEGTVSKLSTYKDGFLILRFIMLFFKEYQPFQFFSVGAVFLMFLSLGLAIPVIVEFYQTGLVPRLPTAVLSASIMLSAIIAFVCGIILDSVSRGRQELKRMAYLSIPPLRKTGS